MTDGHLWVAIGMGRGVVGAVIGPQVEVAGGWDGLLKSPSQGSGLKG